MAQPWGQGQQGFQHPMQTGFNPQFQQNPQFQPQNPQFQQFQPQQQPQFQQGGLGVPNAPGIMPQQTGFPGQRPGGFQQPQPTGFMGAGLGFMQSQPTGVMGNFQQQARAPPPPPPVPPVPQIPSQFMGSANHSFLNAPPPQQPSRLISASPGFGGGSIMSQPTGMGRIGGGPLVPQMTGYVDPRLQMMSQTFMPTDAPSPYGAPQLAPQQQNLVQSIQQHNQAQRGTTNQQMSWALTKAEKKNYNNIFRSWDANGSGFIDGSTALNVFGASGLAKDDLARIWTLADIDDRGKLNIAEFHVAMGLIYRRLNGMPIPDQLPAELLPPSARDLDNSVDMVKDLLDRESRNRSPSSLDTPISRLKNRTLNGSSPSFDSNRDATIYKHSDDLSASVYKPRSRHVDRDAVRSRNEDDSPVADLNDMKRQLASTAQRLDRAAEAEASRTKEDEDLEREMDDLKYRVKRVQDDLDYNSRGPRSTAKDEERRRLERELLNLMHERVPEVERKIKARDENREREKRQRARDRDRANERFGRYDSRDEYSRDRPYSRGDDRDRPYSRSSYDRDDRRDNYRRDRSRSRDRSDRDYDRPRSPPAARSPPPAPTISTSLSRETPPAPSPVPPKPTPSPAPTKNMTPAERQAFARAEAQRRIQARMAALGVNAPSSTPAIDTSVEDRLQQEKKEAEEKAKLAEKQAEEREKARKDRLESEKALKEAKTPTSPASPPSVKAAPPAPASKAPAPRAPAPAPKAPAAKVAPPPPKSRAPAPPAPRKASAIRKPPAPAAPPAYEPPAPVVPPAPEEDDSEAKEQEMLRARAATLRKEREEREARFQEKLRQLEQEEEEAARQEEERRQARLNAFKAKTSKPATPPVEPVAPTRSPVPTPPTPPAVAPVPGPASASVAEKSTNPFSRLLRGSSDSSTPPATNGSSNPWSRPQTAPPTSAPLPSKSPIPSAVKTTYQTAPSAIDDDWDDVKENEDDSDSSDDEISQSRSARANIAQALFGNMLPRPTSAAQASAPTSPAPSGNAPPPPAPPPAAPPAPPSAPKAPAAPMVNSEPPAAAGDVSALMRSIQGGLKLRPTKTVDKSAPPVSGKVLGDTAPPSHINVAPRSVSPPPVAPPEDVHAHIPDSVPAMVSDSNTRSSNRQSVGWFADRAADAGTSPTEIEHLPSTAEDDEDEDVYGTPPASVPSILVDEHPAEPSSDIMADIDKSTQHRTRSLYSFEGEGPEDLSFAENLIILANPSKTGDWWYGTLANSGKSGLFPKTYVEVVIPRKAKAAYTYAGNNPDELSFAEGETLSIVDTSEEEWWKAERDGEVYIVPAAYLEVVEDIPVQRISRSVAAAQVNEGPTGTPKLGTRPRPDIVENQADDEDDSDSDDSNSDYFSFDASEDEDVEAREREKQLVLEAAGLIVNEDASPPPGLTRIRSKRRPAPAAPLRIVSQHKDLPAIPSPEPEVESEPEPVVDHEARLDDAFARYESFKLNQANNMNRLSVVSTDSSMTAPVSPTTTISSMTMVSTQSQHKESDGKYSHFLNFLRSKTPEGERRSATTLNISAPIINGNQSTTSQDGPSRSDSPSFGMSWASLVDKSALEGIPPAERKRQEAIFELINTEIAYVRDLQLIVEVFYSSMLPLLSTKEVTVIFANVEDLLLTNTSFLSSLEERQKECRLYVDNIGDILLNHIPNMGVYMEYCVNQSTACKVLKSLRDSNPELANHLQKLRDEEPSLRNLDLASYLLAPMQRVTRYPLLIKQCLQYTEAGKEHQAIEDSRNKAERLLAVINETIREQEGNETLQRISQHLWIGKGRLDLTARTRDMGPRRLLKEGILLKSKSGRKLYALLCSDILVLTDDSMKNLYRLPIPLAHAQVKPARSRDDTVFHVSQAYPRGGDTIALRAPNARDCQQWIQEITLASKRARQAEERTAKKANGRR